MDLNLRINNVFEEILTNSDVAMNDFNFDRKMISFLLLIFRFQNEQVALICKTGKDTWDRYAISELHNGMIDCLDTELCSVLCMLSL